MDIDNLSELAVSNHQAVVVESCPHDNILDSIWGVR